MRLRDFSIKTKLNVLLAVAAGVSLCVSVIAFVANDVRMIRAARNSQLQAIAELLASNSFDALQRYDRRAAAELLSALRLQPNVTYACIRDPHGQLFAEYRSPASQNERPRVTRSTRYSWASRSLDVSKSIQHGSRTLGTIQLQANTNDLIVTLSHYAPIVALILILSLTSSLLLSTRLRRIISEPILQLASTAQRISADGDCSIRVSRTARDELGTLYSEFNAMLDRIEHGDRQLHEAQSLLEDRVNERTFQLTQVNVDLMHEIAERESAERELATVHEQLVDAARKAGMAEIATGVLHNVGNVLNSVNVSCTLVAERLRRAKFADLERIVELLSPQRERLGEFLQHDEQGKQVLGFLDLLARHLNGEQVFLLREVESLIKNIDHIKSIVVMQQSYAGVSGVIAPVAMSEVLDQAITLNGSALERRGIEVVREYELLPEICADYQKVLQIVVNLLQNAKDALIESDQPAPRVTVRLHRSETDLVHIEVVDNGPGIAAENLSRIFSHGFTTKQAGHGFGLHSCANAAREMGGSLSAQSAGLRRGATFTLELPYQPAEVAV